jgi:EmrB/QacA subfamily drug resistance transporter
MSVRESNRTQLIVIVVIASAVFMSNLDLWIVNVAFVDIGTGLHASLADVSWVLNAYAVTLAALLIPAGRLGDRIGHRKVFLSGVAIFTVASGLCAIAPNLPILVVARIGQAAGAAAQLPSSLALLMAAVPEASRTNAARSWSAVGAVAAVCGPVFGGLLVTLDWRWVFVVNLPIGIAAIVTGHRVLPHPAPRAREPIPDLVGAVLLTVAVASLTGALVQAPTWGWGSTRIAMLLVVAALSSVLFVLRSTRHKHPLLELHLLRVRRFAIANAGTIAFSAAFAIMLLSNSLWCQGVWHYSALRTGFAMAPGPLMVPFVTAWSAKLVHRVGLGPLTAIGSILFAIGFGWRITTAGPAPDYLHDLLPSMIIGGIGVGLALSSFIAAGATALPAERAATASGTVNSGRQIASALGVAVLITVLGTSGSALSRYQIAWWVAIALALIAGVIGLGLGMVRRPAPAAASEPATELV